MIVRDLRLGGEQAEGDFLSSGVGPEVERREIVVDGGTAHDVKGECGCPRARSPPDHGEMPRPEPVEQVVEVSEAGGDAVGASFAANGDRFRYVESLVQNVGEWAYERGRVVEHSVLLSGWGW